jgi:hypothetical protein
MADLGPRTVDEKRDALFMKTDTDADGTSRICYFARHRFGGPPTCRRRGQTLWADGPIPGRYSMLSFGLAVAATFDGEVQGAEAVARQARMYSQLGLVVRAAIVNGTAGWASLQEDRLFSVGAALARNGRIVALYFISGRENLDRLEVEIV